MKAVVQRVFDASVKVQGALCGGISRGLLVYLGVARGDTEADAEKLAEKIAHLRIFNDEEGKMNLSIKDLAAERREPPVFSAEAPAEAPLGILAISQFTLLADTRKGRRPYYGAAAEGGAALTLYECFMRKIGEQGLACRAGIFGAHMELRYTNDGPVTIILDSGEL
ncbi:MAG: D-aminoacyl-tRNA deacylase [Treponema sp.]|nr:D-aminoacyl-tRNA deacylase [Treponema sp.]